MEKWKSVIIALIVCLTICFISSKALDKDIKDVHVKYMIEEGFEFSGSFYNNR